MKREKPAGTILEIWQRETEGSFYEYFVVIISIFKMHFMHFILAELFLKQASLFSVSH